MVVIGDGGGGVVVEGCGGVGGGGCRDAIYLAQHCYHPNDSTLRRAVVPAVLIFHNCFYP